MTSEELSRYVRPYSINGRRYYVHSLPEELPRMYESVSETDNPRAMASHSGPVLLDGEIVHVEPDGELFVAYRGWTGRREHYTPDDFGTDAEKLREVPLDA